jgi:hypothetical protein
MVCARIASGAPSFARSSAKAVSGAASRRGVVHQPGKYAVVVTAGRVVHRTHRTENPIVQEAAGEVDGRDRTTRRPVRSAPRNPLIFTRVAPTDRRRWPIDLRSPAVRAA